MPRPPNEWYAAKYGEYATNRLAVAAIDLAPDAVVVDVGCGRGVVYDVDLLCRVARAFSGQARVIHGPGKGNGKGKGWV